MQRQSVPSSPPARTSSSATRLSSGRVALAARLRGQARRLRRQRTSRCDRSSMKLPPGVNAADFQDAVRRWQAAVGTEWVFTTDDDVALYRGAYSPFWGEDEERVASAAVAPATVEQVQAVVRIANERGIALYPISTGKNLGYGGS